LDELRGVSFRLGANLASFTPMHSLGSVNVEYVADLLVGLACLLIAAVVVAVRVSPRLRRELLLPGLVAGLVILLILCGSAHFASAFANGWFPRQGTISLLASALCCAGSVALVSVVRRPLAERTRNPASYERELAVRRQAEEALRNSEAETRKLVAADARKNEFLAMLGHELRNPLAPIRNAVKIMKQRGSDDPDLSWARDVVEHQVRQLGHLVDDILEISRVTTGKVRLHKEQVDVGTIVAFAVETSRPVVEARHHCLSIALPREPVLVEADSIRMAQVLSNLLNNAVKYTQPGGQIRLAVAVEDGWAVFRVQDNGIGIPRGMLAQIFDLFEQVDHSLDHSQGGLGLGLTLVRSLVEMHAGTVEALSEGLGRGSEFVVRLPLLSTKRTTVESKPGAAAGLPVRVPLHVTVPSRRVLVVDDNVASAQSLALVLKLEGHEVRLAYDGKAALEAVRAFRPEAVLMDIGLPGLDGYEVARRLRADPDLNLNIRLLAAVTGYAEDEARCQSRGAGFDHHLVKPVDPDEVLALLSSLTWGDETSGPRWLSPSPPLPHRLNKLSESAPPQS
jgi:signal transduction histidine kinase/ActR/RegA family two-component response regulator